ncbi:MAG: hypothetical protein P8J87_20270 [Verrucomicrobiales bacterium]|nr:hypothetical protein [Verrucomicrobiales bacterium]
MHARIKECSPASSDAVGTVIDAIYKIEDGTLTLATFDISDDESQKFEGASARYDVKKVALSE